MAPCFLSPNFAFVNWLEDYVPPRFAQGERNYTRRSLGAQGERNYTRRKKRFREKARTSGEMGRGRDRKYTGDRLGRGQNVTTPVQDRISRG